MRKLGIIGGLSWVSTITYYKRINTLVSKQTSPMTSAPLLIESHNFAELFNLLEQDEFDRAGERLVESARALEQAGAQGLLIAANSMHRLYDRIADAVNVPVLHIADAVGARMAADGATANAALLGTRNVMTESFFRRRLVSHGVDLLAPDMDNVETLDRIIYRELMQGKVTRDAERALKTIITRRQQDGAEAIVLACTELEMVVDVEANVLPIYDTTRIHCEAAAEWIVDKAAVPA